MPRIKKGTKKPESDESGMDSETETETTMSTESADEADDKWADFASRLKNSSKPQKVAEDIVEYVQSKANSLSTPGAPTENQWKVFTSLVETKETECLTAAITLWQSNQFDASKAQKKTDDLLKNLINHDHSPKGDLATQRNVADQYESIASSLFWTGKAEKRKDHFWSVWDEITQGNFNHYYVALFAATYEYCCARKKLPSKELTTKLRELTKLLKVIGNQSEINPGGKLWALLMMVSDLLTTKEEELTSEEMKAICEVADVCRTYMDKQYPSEQDDEDDDENDDERKEHENIFLQIYYELINQAAASPNRYSKLIDQEVELVLTRHFADMEKQIEKTGEDIDNCFENTTAWCSASGLLSALAELKPGFLCRPDILDQIVDQFLKAPKSLSATPLDYIFQLYFYAKTNLNKRLDKILKKAFADEHYSVAYSLIIQVVTLRGPLTKHHVDLIEKRILSEDFPAHEMVSAFSALIAISENTSKLMLGRKKLYDHFAYYTACVKSDTRVEHWLQINSVLCSNAMRDPNEARKGLRMMVDWAAGYPDITFRRDVLEHMYRIAHLYPKVVGEFQPWILDNYSTPELNLEVTKVMRILSGDQHRPPPAPKSKACVIL